MDYGDEGLFETIETLKSNGFMFAGAGKNIEEAGKPVIIHHKEHRIGFLAAADRRYQAATEFKPGVFPAKPGLLIPGIKELRNRVGLIILSVHMGMEYIPIPTPAMIDLSDRCRNAGADFIFFHHSHCVSGYTLDKNKATIWGAGNFLFSKTMDFPFKPWFDVAVWQFPYNFSTNQLKVNLRTLRINSEGIPKKSGNKAKKNILSRIENLSSLIHQEKNLHWHILRNVLRVSYLRVIFPNYFNMIRRKGLKSVVSQIRSSIKMLFRKNQ